MSKSPLLFWGEIEWIKNFGGSGLDTAQSIISTSDGGYAVFGFTNSVDGDISDKTMPVVDYWLLKLDVDGNLQWSKTYGGSGEDKGQQVIQTSDGGYALTGYAQSADGDGSNNEGFHDNWIIRLDAKVVFFGKGALVSQAMITRTTLCKPMMADYFYWLFRYYSGSRRRLYRERK